LAASSFRFCVSAAKAEVFAWLYARAEKSGEVVSVFPAEGLFTVLWRGGVVGESAESLKMRFVVRAASTGASRVVVSVNASPERSVAAIEHFSGPLASRMSALERCRTRRDNAMIAGWLGVFVALLAVIVSSRQLPAAGTTMTGGQVLDLIVPVGLAAVAAGVAGGLFVRARGRWYQALGGALVIGWLVSFVVFDVWFNSIAQAPDCTSSHPCDISYGFGAALLAVPEALLLLGGAVLGSALASISSRLTRSAVTSAR
jgi:hypothetical protein